MLQILCSSVRVILNMPKMPVIASAHNTRQYPVLSPPFFGVSHYVAALPSD